MGSDSSPTPIITGVPSISVEGTDMLTFFYHHAFDECNFNIAHNAFQYLLDWTRVAPRVWVWYYAHGGDKMHPLPTFSSLGRNFKRMRDAGVQGVFVQTDFGSEFVKSGGLLDLQSYLYAKLMWNPDYNVQQGIEEFCRDCYGAAAPEMIAFVKMVNDPDTYTGSPAEHYVGIDMTKFPGFHCPGGAMVQIKKEKLAEMDQLFDDALQAVAEDAELLGRVKLVRQAAHYATMLYADQDDPQRDSAIREFFPLAEEQGISRLRLPVNRRELTVEAFRKSFLGLEK